MGRNITALCLAALAGACGCSILEGGVLGVAPLDRDAGSDATLPDADADASADADPSPDADAGTPEAGPCTTGLAGPALVPVGDAGYCIDSTEVTNAQYLVFQNAVPDAGLAVPAYCNKGDVAAWSPAEWTTFRDEERPVASVDWCDAYGYCKWAGKRLCGARSGGSLATGDVAKPDKSQWYYACTGGTSNVYPYGTAYDELKCNGQGSGKATTVNAGLMTDCVGGVPSLHDMSGNVWEWLDSCAGNNNSLNDHCAMSGGGWRDADANRLKCNALDANSPRSKKSDDLGFRCCSL